MFHRGGGKATPALRTLGRDISARAPPVAEEEGFLGDRAMSPPRS